MYYLSDLLTFYPSQKIPLVFAHLLKFLFWKAEEKCSLCDIFTYES